MPFQIALLGPGAAEFGPVDLSAPVSKATAAELRRAFATHPVLVIRNQKLRAGEVADFGRLFGPVETYSAPPPGVAPPTAALMETDGRTTPDQRLYACPEDDGVLLMTNEIRADAAPVAIIDNAETWHSDGSHRPAPYRAVALYAVRNAARGGETEFCDMRALYEALPEGLKAALVGRVAAHHWSKSRNPLFAASLTPQAFAEGERVAARYAETLHPLLCEDPADGRPHLFLSPRFTLRAPDLPEEISRTLLDNLFALMDEPAFVYRHIWREGDLVLWDNRRTNHRVRAYGADDLRSRYRVTISAAGPMQPYAVAGPNPMWPFAQAA
jgi:taurine dioxygenase